MSNTAPDTVEAFPDIWIIPSSALLERQYRARTWSVTAPLGMPLEALSSGAAWSRVGAGLTEFDRIEVLAADRSWWCELICLESGPSSALLRPLAKVQFPRAMQDNDDIPPGLSIFWRATDSGRGMYMVRNVVTGAVYPHGFASRPAAAIFANEQRPHQTNGSAA